MFKIKVNTTVLAILCSTAIEVNGAANINTIMNTEIKVEQTITEPELVNELCIFNCKLQRIGGPTLTEINKGLDDLYFLELLRIARCKKNSTISKNASNIPEPMMADKSPGFIFY